MSALFSLSFQTYISFLSVENKKKERFLMNVRARVFKWIVNWTSCSLQAAVRAAAVIQFTKEPRI